MLALSELLSIFSKLNTQEKEKLYNILIDYAKLKGDAEYLGLLSDLKDELLEENEIFEERKLYLTLEELALMFDISKRTVQRIIKRHGIKPINPNNKPLLYDLDEFEKAYFPIKNREKEKYYIDFSNNFPILKERPVIADIELIAKTETSSKSSYEEIDYIKEPSVKDYKIKWNENEKESLEEIEYEII